MLTVQHIRNVPAALTAAEAGDWAGCSSALITHSITLEGLRISGKQTILGLAALQVDPDRIRLVLESTPSGRGLLDLLPGVGVNWVDPLTLVVLAKNTGDGKLSTADVDALKSLSARVVSPADQLGLSDDDCTPETCSAAWAAGIAAELKKRQSDAVDQAVAAAQQLQAETSADLAAVIATFTTTLTQHWS